MAKSTTQEKKATLPNGAIDQVIGPIVDIRCPNQTLPVLLTALEIRPKVRLKRSGKQWARQELNNGHRYYRSKFQVRPITKSH